MRRGWFICGRRAARGLPDWPARARACAQALAFSAAAGCAHPSGPPGPPRAETKRAAGVEAEPGGAGVKDAEVEAAAEAVAEALEAVAEVRKLAVLRPVRAVVLTREQMTERVREHIDDDVPPDVIAGQEEVLIALGAAPADFDIKASMVSLMASELAGLYEPEDQTMYLAADLEGEERAATLSHELVHALQDQHYDLGKLIEHREERSDSLSAVHALAEGDATSAMIDAMLVGQQMSALDLPETTLSVNVRAAMELSPGAAAVPSILKRSVISPYVDGLEFVHALRRREGWASVDSAWNALPSTTEQVLHPHRFLAKEGAEQFAAPPPPPDGMMSGQPVGQPARSAAAANEPLQEFYRDVFGEQSLRVVFEEWMPRTAAVDAASHWAGDQLVAFRRDQDFAVAWRVRYDDAISASRGFEAFARGALNTSDAAADPKAAARAAVPRREVCIGRDALGPFAVTHRDRDVAVVLGPYTRRSGAAVSASNCAAALRWARAALESRKPAP